MRRDRSFTRRLADVRSRPVTDGQPRYGTDRFRLAAAIQASAMNHSSNRYLTLVNLWARCPLNALLKRRAQGAGPLRVLRAASFM